MHSYRAFVDAMVDIARRSVTAKRIAATGHAERTNDRDLPLDTKESARKALLKSLSAEQRATLSEMFVEERIGAVHDVLAYLEWAVSCGHMEMQADGEAFDGAADETIHGDFTARMEGEAWGRQ